MSKRTPEMGRPTLEEAAALKETLLQQALEMLCSRGPDGLSMDALAKNAGMSKRTIYRHFESKTALIDAVVKREAKRLSAPLLPWAQGITNPLEALRAWSWNYFCYLIEPETRRFTTFLTFACLNDPEFADLLTGWGSQMRDPLMELIIDSQGAGVLRQGDPIQVTLLLFDLLNGSSHRLQFNYPADLITGGLSREEFFATRWAAFLRLAGTSPEAYRVSGHHAKAAE